MKPKTEHGTPVPCSIVGWTHDITERHNNDTSNLLNYVRTVGPLLWGDAMIPTLSATEFIALFVGAVMLCDLPVILFQHFSKGEEVSSE